MTNTEILSKYNKQSRQLSKLFSWLDENEIQLDEICKEDVELFFKVIPVQEIQAGTLNRV